MHFQAHWLGLVLLSSLVLCHGHLLHVGEGVGCTIPVPHLIKRVCALEAPAQGNLGKKALSKVWTCTFKTGRGYIFVEEPCPNDEICSQPKYNEADYQESPLVRYLWSVKCGKDWFLDPPAHDPLPTPNQPPDLSVVASWSSKNDKAVKKLSKDRRPDGLADGRPAKKQKKGPATVDQDTSQPVAPYKPIAGSSKAGALPNSQITAHTLPPHTPPTLNVAFTAEEYEFLDGLPTVQSIAMPRPLPGWPLNVAHLEEEAAKQLAQSSKQHTPVQRMVKRPQWMRV